ncbi:MAG: hypothetical protein AB1705_24625 [Verrucomicrobiota bacterium]
MKTIPIETVTEAWDRFSSIPEEDIEDLLNRVAHQQPCIVAYLLAADEEYMRGVQQGTLLFIGLTIHEIMAEGRPHMAPVDSAAIDAMEQKNIEFIERMAEESEIHQRTDSLWMVQNYNQMPLLGAALEALMADWEDAPEMADENLGMMLLHLKTVIDCLDQ